MASNLGKYADPSYDKRMAGVGVPTTTRSDGLTACLERMAQHIERLQTGQGNIMALIDKLGGQIPTPGSEIKSGPPDVPSATLFLARRIESQLIALADLQQGSVDRLNEISG